MTGFWTGFSKRAEEEAQPAGHKGYIGPAAAIIGGLAAAKGMGRVKGDILKGLANDAKSVKGWRNMFHTPSGRKLLKERVAAAPRAASAASRLRVGGGALAGGGAVEAFHRKKENDAMDKQGEESSGSSGYVGPILAGLVGAGLMYHGSGAKSKAIAELGGARKIQGKWFRRSKTKALHKDIGDWAEVKKHLGTAEQVGGGALGAAGVVEALRRKKQNSEQNKNSGE